MDDYRLQIIEYSIRAGGMIAHTFSCKLRVLYFTQFLNLKSLLTVLCVNMSKNDVIYDLRIYDLRFSEPQRLGGE